VTRRIDEKQRSPHHLGMVAAGLGVALVTIWLATSWLAIPWSIAGPSMEPTLRAGDRVLVDVWTYRQRGPRRGEVALLVDPGGLAMVKRVARSGPLGLSVLGDNPGASRDSRQFGAVPVDRFRGRVFFRIWPASRIGPVR